MVKKRQYLVCLVAWIALMTGSYGKAAAAVIDEVRITSPGTGQYRGIDSLICVEVKARFTAQPDSASTVYIWLVKDGDPAQVLAEPANTAGAVTNEIRTGKPAIAIPAGDFVAGSVDIAGHSAENVSQGSALVRRQGGIFSVVYTIKIKIPPTAGTCPNVRVAAYLLDEERNRSIPLEARTPVLVSPADVTLMIDADRPHPGNLRFSSITVGAGWSMYSVPLAAADPSLSTLIPTAQSLFHFDPGQGYVPASGLACGQGVWLKLPAATQITLTGDPCPLVPVEQPAGWSLSGPPGATVDVACLQAASGGNLLAVFGYNPVFGYHKVTQMQPGQGYWVKLAAAGPLDFQACVTAPKVAGGPAVAPVSGWLWVQAGAHRALVRLGGDSPDELPPAPPAARPDLRVLVDGQWQDGVPLWGGEQDYPLHLQSGHELGWMIPAAQNGRWALVVKSRVYPLEGQGHIEVETGQSAVLRRLAAAQEPRASSLEQNYPNPFNPSTTIGYVLEEGGHTRLRVYDVMGRVVRELLDAWQPAGRHLVVWDGLDAAGHRVANGVYIYELRSNGFRARRSMLLLK